MKLLISPTSPYARTARMAVSVLELDKEVTIQTVNHRGHDETLLVRNPLGKVPTLILENEEVLYDSRVILDCLYERKGKAAFQFRGPDKYQGLTRQALAAGLMDCTIAAAIETRNHDQDRQNSQWIDRQEGKILRALAMLDQAHLVTDFAPLPSADQLFLASALGYLDFTTQGTWWGKWQQSWQQAHPNLAQWLQEFADAVPAFGATTPTA
ncbi:glutathione S-transferase N-terminal domain-containing protein [Cohaesibacter intestini]|uniref:glutathione S-transferase N-terminal domain-containing protein n=1 Tax=Cohaesibacter intestini TaxID=2211145 RepID=UPI0013005ED4|nr:glutathione S-transferase N-terminal domain-containing protein [Cohaesibacter intestini]